MNKSTEQKGQQLCILCGDAVEKEVKLILRWLRKFELFEMHVPNYEPKIPFKREIQRASELKAIIIHALKNRTYRG